MGMKIGLSSIDIALLRNSARATLHVKHDQLNLTVEIERKPGGYLKITAFDDFGHFRGGKVGTATTDRVRQLLVA
jgi:hypothetical protein